MHSMDVGKKFRNLINIPRSIHHYKMRHTILPYLPNAIWIEPTNICNLKCIMCPNSIMEQKNLGYMEFGLYKKVIDEAKDFVSYATLCISGESLLNRNFPRMVEYAKDNGIHTYLSTNATVLTNELSRQILEIGLDWINFSFDGCTKEVYEKIRVNANFEKTLKNIVEFLRLKKEMRAKTQVEIQILVMDADGIRNFYDNVEEFLSNFKGLPLDFVQIRKPSTWGLFFSKTDKFTPKQTGSCFSPCSYLWSSLHVLWDGRVVACTSDFFGTNTLGKFPERSLKEIWNGLPMRNFREAMLNNQYLDFNRNCEGCDSLWEEAIFGLPAGIRGISAITISNIFDKNLLIFCKRLARFLNPNFAMTGVSRDCTANE